jgi:hypothetical protein
MGRVVDRLAAQIVVDQQRCEVVRGRDTPSVEMGQRSVAVAEHATIGQHAVDGVEERLRHVDAPAGKDLA